MSDQATARATQEYGAQTSLGGSHVEAAPNVLRVLAYVADLCVAYSLSHQFVDSLAIGTRSNQQMIDDLAYCLNAPLTADERAAVEERLDSVMA